MKKSIVAKSSASVLLVSLAAAGTTLMAAPANADVDRPGSCAGAMYEFSVDRDGGGFEVSVDVDNAAPNSSWRGAIRHNGRLLQARTLRADAEGEFELSAFRINRPGVDRFKMVLTPAGGSACAKVITLR